MPGSKITWSSEAIEALNKILDYIFSEWGINPVLEFDDELKRLILAIENNKRLCSKSKVIGLRKCVLSRQTSLIYEYSKNRFEIVTFIDNRGNHPY